MQYRLGLDLGATSIGWAIYNIEDNVLINMGVRIFDDGREDKSKASLCVKRRSARGIRRLQNRRRMQKQELLNKLIQFGLFPENNEERQQLKLFNPYELRTKALDEKLSLYEIGRVCFSLVQRKGFLSNRKDNKEEGGKLKEGYKRLKDAMASVSARTYGEYLYLKMQSEQNAIIRLKNTFDAVSGKFVGGEFPFREIYKDEFQIIFNKQKQYYPTVLTDDVCHTLENILYFQRPLKEAEEGWCTFEDGERCIAKAHPLFQEFRIWQHLMNLTFSEDCSTVYEMLDTDRRNLLIDILQHPAEYITTKKAILTYKNIKTLLNLDKKGMFNFECKKNVSNADMQNGILANTTEYAMAQTDCLSEEWNNLNRADKEMLINVLCRPESYIDFPKTKRSIEEQDEIIMNYMIAQFGLSQEGAKELLYEVDLEEGYASLSEKAIRKILAEMKKGLPYDAACLEAGYHHSVKNYTELDSLPYYGEILAKSCLGQKANPRIPEEKYGKINNATVHVALNQIRHLVNTLIREYGKPYDISIEYGRDLPASMQERKKLSDTRDKNEIENQRIEKLLSERIGLTHCNKRDIEKYKIWDKQGIGKGGNRALERECPFCGKTIALSDLLSDGYNFQIEHLIPFSRSFDDSLDNKVICCVACNRLKGNKTPYEAFSEMDFWPDIQRRAKKLSEEQQWRFGKDAMKKFEDKEGPIARSLNDTRYMTRILQDYLKPIVHSEGKKTVQSVVGQLTSMVRKAWGLNQYKNKDSKEDYRSLHYHHALDAAVIAMISRGQIARVAQELKNIHSSVYQQFKDEFWKLKDEMVSKEDKTDLRKRIKAFTQDRKEAIVQQHISMPEGITVPTLIEQVEKINVSHKPKLKNVADKNSTVGQLHEDTAYGLRSFIAETGLTARFVCNKKVVEKDVTEYIPMFYNREDKKAYYDAYKNWFVVERKAKTIDAQTSAEKAIKKEWEQKEAQAVQVLRETATKAFKWFVGGGNYCAEIYQINPQNKIGGVATKDRGEWKSEVISNYNATIRERRGEHIAYWRYRYPNAKRIMSLKRNDMVIGVFTREQAYDVGFPLGIKAYVQAIFEKNLELQQTEVLFRVKKISSNGTVFLTPHDIAKEELDKKSWISSSLSLQRYHAHKVYVTPTGRIQNAK